MLVAVASGIRVGKFIFVVLSIQHSPIRCTE